MPKIRILQRSLQEISKVFLRKKAHRYFAIEEYEAALEWGLEADRAAVEEGHAYRFGKPIPESVRKPDVISARDFPASMDVALLRETLRQDSYRKWNCEQEAEPCHLAIMYLPWPELSRYLPNQATKCFSMDPRDETYARMRNPMERLLADYARDFPIAAEWLWFVGRFTEARENIANAFEGLEIRKAIKQSGPGRSDRIRLGCELFDGWMDLKEKKISPNEKELYRILDLMERYLAAFSSEQYDPPSSCQSYRAMLRVYSNWFKLEYGLDWPKREEFLNCFPHYCRPYPAAFAQLSKEKKLEVERWYAEVLRLADEWDIEAYREYCNQ